MNYGVNNYITTKSFKSCFQQHLITSQCRTVVSNSAECFMRLKRD